MNHEWHHVLLGRERVRDFIRQLMKEMLQSEKGDIMGWWGQIGGRLLLSNWGSHVMCLL